MASHVKNCNKCHAPVRWAETDRGKTILVDADPVESGDLALTHLDPQGKEMRVRVLRRNETVEAHVPQYTCHFGTCPMREPRDNEDRSRRGQRVS